MDKLKINQYKSAFDVIAHYIENEQYEQVEVWFARELQTILGYARWENFVVAINRAVESCKTQQIQVDDHFREVTKMVQLGSGAQRKVEDYMLMWF
jgi:DNA-damage-inducible protein D